LEDCFYEQETKQTTCNRMLKYNIILKVHLLNPEQMAPFYVQHSTRVPGALIKVCADDLSHKLQYVLRRDSAQRQVFLIT
jgi:hypothetical protein